MKVRAALLGLLVLTWSMGIMPADEDKDKTKAALAAVKAEADVIAGQDALTGIKLNKVSAAVKDLETKVKKVEQEQHLEEPRPGPSSKVEVAPVFEAANMQLRIAQELQTQVTAALDRARAATNPAVAAVELKDAKIKAEQRMSLLAKADAVVHPRETEPNVQEARPGGHSIEISDTWSLLEDLKRRAGLAKLSYKELKDSGASADIGRAFSNARSYDASNETIVPDGGQPISVQPLAEAFHSAMPGKPLFVDIPPQAGRKAAVVPSPELEKYLGSPQLERDRRQLGGVDLQVTLDMLSFNKVSGFAKPGPAASVDNPVLVSIKELQRQAARHASAWRDLPESLRYPGSIERLRGFVLDDRNGDVFLVGAKARSQETRLDIDDLIVGLHAAYLEGSTPGVSLDPMPDDPGGPQHARILGVPDDCSFAKAMLDADYAMKRLTIGDLTIETTGFKTLPQILGDQPFRGTSRFWLFPTPMGANDIRVSDTARSVLFETGVRLLTMSQRAVSGRYEDTGARDKHCEEAAGLFTNSYDEFERSAQIAPRHIFLKLHGLIDLVTIARILRDMDVRYGALRDFCSLPYSHVEVPRYYPGVKATWGDSGSLTLVGGVEARARAGDHAAAWYRDTVTEALEQAADSFARGGGVAQSVALHLTLPRPGGAEEITAENLRVAGHAAMALKQYGAARDRFREASSADPFYAEVWADLASCESLLGNHAAAADAVRRALALKPGDLDLQVMRLDLELRADPKLDLDSKDDSIRRMLSNEYVSRAAADLLQGRSEEARNEADTALRLADDNADAYFMRALGGGDISSEEAGEDLLHAVGQFRKQARRNGEASVKVPLARALALHAEGRFARLRRQIVEGGITEANVRRLLDESTRAADEAKEARLFDDASPEAMATEALARAVKVELLKATGQEGDPANALDLANQAVRRFADFAPAHSARAYVLNVAGSRDDAIAEMGRTIELDVTHGPWYLQRAELYSEAGDADKAGADLDKAKMLGAKISPELEKKLRGGR